MRKGVLAVLAVVALVFGVVGCSNGLATSSGDANSGSGTGLAGSSSVEAADGVQALGVSDASTLGGVTVTLNEVAMWQEESYRYNLAYDVTIKNDSSEDIMSVMYAVTLFDADGNEIRSFAKIYDGEDHVLAAGEETDDSFEGVAGKDHAPATVTVEVTSVTTAAELPPVHLPQEGEYLYQAIGDDKLANIEEEPPVKMTFHQDQGGAGKTALFSDGGSLSQAIDLFCDIRIGAESGEWVTDNYNYVAFEWADGTQSFVSLNLRNLEFSAHPNMAHTYELENLDAFWSFALSCAVEDDVTGGGEDA